VRSARRALGAQGLGLERDLVLGADVLERGRQAMLERAGVGLVGQERDDLGETDGSAVAAETLEAHDELLGHPMHGRALGKAVLVAASGALHERDDGRAEADERSRTIARRRAAVLVLAHLADESIELGTVPFHLPSQSKDGVYFTSSRWRPCGLSEMTRILGEIHVFVNHPRYIMNQSGCHAFPR